MGDSKMNMQIVRYGVDALMGVVFLICFVTGLFKFTLLIRMLGLTGIVMPVALMSDIHDWSGIALGVLVAAHLVINRRWVLAMTRRILKHNPVDTDA
jgi:hypothetical protein